MKRHKQKNYILRTKSGEAKLWRRWIIAVMLMQAFLVLNLITCLPADALSAEAGIFDKANRELSNNLAPALKISSSEFRHNLNQAFRLKRPFWPLRTIVPVDESIERAVAQAERILGISGIEFKLGFKEKGKKQTLVILFKFRDQERKIAIDNAASLSEPILSNRIIEEFFSFYKRRFSGKDGYFYSVNSIENFSKKQLLRLISGKAKKGNRSLDIWICGYSVGVEIRTYLTMLEEAFKSYNAENPRSKEKLADWQIKIVGTDVLRSCLQAARKKTPAKYLLASGKRRGRTIIDYQLVDLGNDTWLERFGSFNANFDVIFYNLPGYLSPACENSANVAKGLLDLLKSGGYLITDDSAGDVIKAKAKELSVQLNVRKYGAHDPQPIMVLYRVRQPTAVKTSLALSGFKSPRQAQALIGESI